VYLAKDNSVLDNSIGITQLAIDHIFNAISVEESGKFLVTASYLQIYNEEITDLLAPKSSKKLDLRGDGTQGVVVADLKWIKVSSYQETRALLSEGAKRRVAAATDMNAESSRSHAIFTLKVEHIRDEGHVTVGKLHLVDLAGSERQSKTNVLPDSCRFKESTHINLSLSALGNVISALTDNKGGHIPYRDSKLTRILQNSLGGNARTLMICNVSPADSNHAESLQTLRFASRAKTIKNRPSINEDPKDAALRNMALEIQKLKQDLATKETLLQQQQQQQQQSLIHNQQQHQLPDADNIRGMDQQQPNGEKNEQQQRGELRQQKLLQEQQQQQLEEARQATKVKLRSLYEKLAGGEKKDDSEAKRKRNTMLEAVHLVETQLQLGTEGGGGGGGREESGSIDQAEGYILEEFANLNEELEYLRETLKAEVEKRVAAESEAEDAKGEAEELRAEKSELLEAYREKEWLLKEYMRKGMLLEDVVDQLWQLTEPNCNYYDLEEVVRQSEWHRDTATWFVPKIRFDSDQANKKVNVKLPLIQKSNVGGNSSNSSNSSNSNTNGCPNSSAGSRAPLRLPQISKSFQGGKGCSSLRSNDSASGFDSGVGGEKTRLRPFSSPAPLLDRWWREDVEEDGVDATTGDGFDDDGHVEDDGEKGEERCPTPMPPSMPTTTKTTTTTKSNREIEAVLDANQNRDRGPDITDLEESRPRGAGGRGGAGAGAGGGGARGGRDGAGAVQGAESKRGEITRCAAKVMKRISRNYNGNNAVREVEEGQLCLEWNDEDEVEGGEEEEEKK